MQSRQRYHIIVNASENVQELRELLEQSSLVDIKSWSSFPLLLNVSLTTEQAEWARTLPMVVSVAETTGIYLHAEITPVQYEIQTNDVSVIDDLRKDILRHMDIVVNWYNSLPTSLFVTLDETQYKAFLSLIPLGGSFSSITNITANSSPIREYSRILDLQKYNWGVERITHRTNSFYETIKLTRTGNGVRVFVVDTGVQSNHNELVGRVNQTYRYDAFRSIGDPLYGEPSLKVKDDVLTVLTDDHGTHVASLIAGSTVGVATHAEIVSVRAFSNFETSTTEHLIDAIDWVIQTHNLLGGPSVVNMSLAFSSETSNIKVLGEMLTGALISAGITVVVSAGNEGTDAFQVSPANAGCSRELKTVGTKSFLETQVDEAKKPIVVGASVYPHSSPTSKDMIWHKSNWGDVVDLFAPGHEIYGASLQIENDEVNLIYTGSYDLKSGTSMAAPIVSGICALHLEATPTLTHLELRKKLIAQATVNPFDPDSVRHERIDDPRFTTAGSAIELSTIDNQYVLSPNRLAYAWFTNTRIEWPEQEFLVSVDENTSKMFSFTANSTDYYRDSELVDFSYDSLDLPPSYETLGFLTFYKTLDYVSSVGNIPVYTSKANVRINAPTVSTDIAGSYVLLADDGRVISARRFEIKTLNVPKPPVWVSPNAGEIMISPAHKGDIFDADNTLFTVSHEDNLPISFSISPSNSLPPGVQFINDSDNSRAFLRGRISSLPYSETPIVYEFLVRATASNGMIAERLFTLTCEYVNEVHYFNRAWLSSMYEYDNHPTVKDFGSAGSGNSFYRYIDVVNRDSDPLRFLIDFVPTVLAGPSVFNGALPTGIGLNNDGEISGIIDPSAPVGLYFFRVRVLDQDGNEIAQDFVLSLGSSNDVLQGSDQIIWITPTGNIGQVYETFPSHLSVEARNPDGQSVRYAISPAGGILPDGMDLDPYTGLIVGLAPFVSNSIEYHFVVRAFVGSRFVDRAFSFTIVSQYEGASVLNFKANITGPDRLTIANWTLANRHISSAELFRPEDPYFGSPRTPYMYVLSGTSVIQPTEVMNYLKDYHKRMYLLFGPLNWAPAYDPSGYHAYDVIYMSVLDPLAKAGGFDEFLKEQTLLEKQSKPYDLNLWNQQDKMSRYFPNSIKNARADLISQVEGRQGLGLVGEEGLPLWMRTKKSPSRSEIVGFVPAVVVAYVKAGKGQELTNRLASAGYNREFLGREFILDRYYISDIITKTTTLFDVVDSEPTTIFDEPNIGDHPLPPSPPYEPQDPTDFEDVVQQTLFDVKTVETGKYYKFEDDMPILADRLQNQYR